MKMFASALVTCVLFLAVQDVQAFDPHGGNALWGKYAIQTCRSCHKEKGLTSLDPQERSAEKWEALFANDYRKLREMSHDFNAVGINDRQLENIHRYLVESAGSGGAPAATVQKTSSSAKKTAASSSEKKTVATGERRFDMEAGSSRRGRYTFRKCLSCHKKNNAPVISPGDRTKKAWDRYFDRDFRKFKRAMPKFDTYKFSVTQMEDLHQFLRQYALDAAQPKTCE